MAHMQVSPEQGQFMSLLVKLTGATKELEVGVYTGYSSLRVALALLPHGRMIACDVNKEWTATAHVIGKKRVFWKRLISTCLPRLRRWTNFSQIISRIPLISCSSTQTR